MAKVSNTHNTMTAKASTAPRVEARANRAANQVIIAIRTVSQAARKVSPKGPTGLKARRGAPARCCASAVAPTPALLDELNYKRLAPAVSHESLGPSRADRAIAASSYCWNTKRPRSRQQTLRGAQERLFHDVVSTDAGS